MTDQALLTAVRRVLPIVLCAVVSIWLSGCGQTGALVLPGELSPSDETTAGDVPADTDDTDEEQDEQ